jgi:hypothetical protein
MFANENAPAACQYRTIGSPSTEASPPRIMPRWPTNFPAFKPSKTSNIGEVRCRFLATFESISAEVPSQPAADRQRSDQGNRLQGSRQHARPRRADESLRHRQEQGEVRPVGAQLCAGDRLRSVPSALRLEQPRCLHPALRRDHADRQGA